jgi:putative tryptophan/tyrosine transport system substrate-binding protein
MELENELFNPYEAVEELTGGNSIRYETELCWVPTRHRAWHSSRKKYTSDGSGVIKRSPKPFLASFVFFNILVGGTGFVAEAKKMAVIWDTKSAMPTNVNKGLLAKLRELAPDLNVTLYRELKDMEEAKKIFHQCESSMNGIVFLRCSGAQFLSKIEPKVPCFAGACNNPVEIGVVKNLNAPEGMVTGVTYFIPYETRFRDIKSLFPNVKSLALLVEKEHPSGPIEQAGTREQCQKLGIAYNEVVASDLKELLEGTKSLGEVDLLVLTNTKVVMDHVGSLLMIANPARIPMFSYADMPVKAGAVAGIAADDLKFRAMLAQSVVDVVIHGKPVSQVPVRLDPQPKLTVNEGMMRGLGLQFPEAILTGAEIVR